MENFYDDMSVNLSSLEGKSVSFSYGTFKNFESLILEHIDNNLPLDVKIAPCGCDNLDCHVCKSKWSIDTWIPFEPLNMFYAPVAVEGTGVTKVYAIRPSITKSQKEEAVKILQEIGYTIKSGDKCWKPPLGNNPIKTKNNITQFLQKKFAESDENGLTPHVNFIAALSEDIIEMVETGLSERQIRDNARENAKVYRDEDDL